MVALVQNLSTTCVSSQDRINLETQLSDFIQWSLSLTRTNQYSTEQAMQLLDQAWIAQKLLWQLRHEWV